MDQQTLVDRNLEFASTFDKGELAIPPRLATLIVTCLDARVDPAHFLDLDLGDAFVIRNVGGRVTEEVIEHIAILRALTAVAGGAPFAVAVVHHTDCGTTRFADNQIRKELSRAAGIDESIIERLATTDPEVSVRMDLAQLRASRALPDDLVVAGYVYGVTDGYLRTTSAPAPLRDGTE